MYNLNFISWLLNAELGNFNIFLMQFLYGILYSLLHMHAYWNMEYIRLWHTDCGTHIWVLDIGTSLHWHKVTQDISEWCSRCFWVSLPCLYTVSLTEQKIRLRTGLLLLFGVGVFLLFVFSFLVGWLAVFFFFNWRCFLQPPPYKASPIQLFRLQ